jgi:hypothetical protein
MNPLCVSHGEDPDGIICATFVKRLNGAAIRLATYDDLEETLGTIQPPVTELFVCDLSIREDLAPEILRINGFAPVTLVDHHPTARPVLESLKDTGVTVIYSPLDCAAVLLYHRYRATLGQDGARLAAYAAVSDLFEEGPIARRLLSNMDRLFVCHEALILHHALQQHPSTQFKRRVVEELSHGAFPHRIEGMTAAATDQLEHTATLLTTLPSSATKLTKLAHVDGEGEPSTGMIATLLLESTGVAVGLCYKRRAAGVTNVSVRGAVDLERHLGEITQRLAGRYGGFGGGHSRASGASLPTPSLMDFIRDFDDAL